MKKLTLLLALTLAAVTVTAQDISPARIKATMDFLASDLLEGRGTATRGHMVAAQYVAAQYEALGLEPGAAGSYFQSVPFVKTTATDASFMRFATGDQTSGDLKLAVDFTSTGDPLHDTLDVNAPVVYAGYGVTAPEQGYDDYAKLDVRGKVVAIFNGAPSQFSGDLRAHYSAARTKLENASAHGAVAVIQLRSAETRQRTTWERVARQSRLGTMNWTDANGIARGLAAVSTTVTLSDRAAAMLFGDKFEPMAEAAGKGALPGFATTTTATIHLVSTNERVSSPNVIGILRGSELPNEYVIYSAHLDHLGISAPVNGDAINNGALDNASGIAAMLEVARAFASGPRPRRSILFLATTGEEKGLKGADYFANNPTVPAAAMVADINIDEIWMFAPTRDVLAIGGEHTTLGDAVARAGKAMNIEVSPDPFPEEVVFVRSDQYPFVRRGVPAVYVGAGYKAVDPNVNLLARIRDWNKTIYHTPKDDMTQPLDFTVGAMVARFDYLLGTDVANAAARPSWRAGDFFGQMFGTKMP
jgi:hypothetical protein